MHIIYTSVVHWNRISNFYQSPTKYEFNALVLELRCPKCLCIIHTTHIVSKNSEIIFKNLKLFFINPALSFWEYKRKFKKNSLKFFLCTYKMYLVLRLRKFTYLLSQAFRVALKNSIFYLKLLKSPALIRIVFLKSRGSKVQTCVISLLYLLNFLFYFELTISFKI